MRAVAVIVFVIILVVVALFLVHSLGRGGNSSRARAHAHSHHTHPSDRGIDRNESGESDRRSARRSQTAHGARACVGGARLSTQTHARRRVCTGRQAAAALCLL